MATRFGITGWPPATAINAAFALLQTWFDGRDERTSLEIDEAVGRTRDYVSQNLHRFLQLDGSGGVMHDGWRDPDWIYITPEAWKTIHAEDANAAARMHKTKGILKTQKGNSLQFRMGRDVPGRPRVYAVRLDALTEFVTA
ncbi:hypothetical protein ACGKZZ_16925 [Marivita sp. S2033]